MKILLLNQVFHPDVVSTAQHLSGLAVALQALGHEVTAVTGRRAYDEPDRTFPAQETWRGVRIIRVFSTRFGKHARWRRAADFASFMLFCGARLLLLPRQDVVVTLTTPPLISFIGAWRAKLWRARFVYWVMDLNPDEAVAAGWLRADSVADRMLERMSRFSLRRADRTIALDRFMSDRIASKGIAREKIVVIPPWSQDQDVNFDAIGREQFRIAHGLQDKFVVMYSGNHSPVHPLDTLMQAADALRAEKQILFCFVGGGSEFKRIQRRAQEAKRANILCLPYQPLNRLAASLSAADAHVVVMGDAMLGLVHPCKIYNVLLVGGPVIYIGPAPSHVTELLQAPNAHRPWIGVQHGQPEQLAAFIRGLAENAGSIPRGTTGKIAGAFSESAVLPQMISAIEGSSPAGLRQ